MKFWVKLDLSIILIIAIILSFSRFMIVRQNFRYSIENCVVQNMNQHKLERYFLESSMINQIQKGEPITNEEVMDVIQNLFTYVQNNTGSVALFNENREIIFCNFEEINQIQINNLLQEEDSCYCLRELDGKYYMLISSSWSINHQVFYMMDVCDISVIYQEREKQLQDIRYADIAILMVSSFFISIFSRILTRPIEKLNKMSQKIASGKFHERVKVKTNDEIGELANSFNKMADVIESKIHFLNQSLEAKDNFITGFSHEIKTPMTAIIGYSDLLRLKKCDEKVSEKALHYIYSEAKRLEELSYKLLSLMELSEDGIEFQKVQVKEVIYKMIKRMVVEDVELEVDLEEAMIEVDENLLETVIRNLVQNAKKAEPRDKRVSIIGRKLENQKYRISVLDHGKGIPKECVSRVTEDFFMVDKSRSRQSGGTGIGLSLCQKILKLHHSQIQVESEENVGTKVWFDL